MTWIEGTADREYVVARPYDEVVDFFADPAEFKSAMVDLESAERVDDDTWRWTLEQKGAKGISFQGKYTVRYDRDGDIVTWETVGDGNMRSEGKATFEELDDDRTRVHYHSEMAADLPIPGLMAKAFNKIIAREVKKGVESFLDNAKQQLEEGR